MIRQHFAAFAWLRWRLMANAWRRAGAFNAVVMIAAFIGAVLLAVPILIGSFYAGVYAIPKAEPLYLMLAWDALLAVFLFFWAIGLLTELQRTDGLTLSKFMHLPVSLKGAFLINYAGSLLRLSLIVFGPMMLGFAASLVYVKGAAMLPTFLMLAAFLLMVTALTYQFQGWLALLMSNPRRRRTIVVGLTMAFVLVFQIPNLFNFFGPQWSRRNREVRVARTAAWGKKAQELNVEMAAGTITQEEFDRRRREMEEAQREEIRQDDRQMFAKVGQVARVVNTVLPIGWLPLGVEAQAEGRFLPPLLGFAGMAAIGAVSLRRAYRTTAALYLGQADARPAPRAAIARTSAGPKVTADTMLDAHVPWVSEPVAAVALASLRSVLRAPEAKMMLLTPLITGVIFGSMLWNNRNSISDTLRPTIALGIMGFVLLGLLQLMGNQFGFDRNGFRVFVLGAASRRDVLLGKNLAFAPLAFGLALVELAVFQVICPLRLDHLAAMPFLYVVMYLPFCAFANLSSIYTPVNLPAGTLKASNPKATTVLLQMLLFLVLFPLTQAPAFLPFGVESLLRLLGVWGRVPIALFLSMVECALVTAAYALSLGWQGSLLQEREQAILETVTSRVA